MAGLFYGKKRIFIYAAVVILLFCGSAIFFLNLEKSGVESCFQTLYLTDRESHDGAVRCTASQEGFAFFLPSGYSQSQQIFFEEASFMEWNGKIYHSGDTVSLEEGMQGEACFYSEEGAETESGNLSVYRAGELPSLHVIMNKSDVEYIKEEKGNEAEARYVLCTAKGELTEQGKIAGIKTRGNSTWYSPKKSYSIKLDEAEDWLGTGQETEDEWILLANYLDGSYIRNYLGQLLGKAAEIPYSPDMEFVNLYLNEEYQGLYLLSENVKEKDGRRNDPEQTIMELDYPGRVSEADEWIVLENNQPLVIHSPRNVSEKQKEEIREKWMGILKELEETPEQDDIWQKLDLDSFAAMYIMEEVIQDTDIGGASRYFYFKTEDGEEKLYAGPLWDLDQALGNDWQETENLFVSSRNLSTNNLCRWYTQLLKNDTFCTRVREIYSQSVSPALHELVEQGVEEIETRIAASVKMDEAVWGGGRTVRNTDFTYEQHMDYLIQYMEKRTEYLDRVWIAGEEAESNLQELPTLDDMPLQEGSLFEKGEELIRYLGKGTEYLEDELKELSERGWTISQLLPLDDILLTEEEEAGILQWIMQNHGFVAFGAVVIAVGGLLVWDRKKNSPGGKKKKKGRW